MPSKSFQQFSAVCAALAGVAGFLYAVAFIVLKNPLLYSLSLLLVGLFSGAALLGVYYRVRETDAAFALWALLLGLTGTAGSAIHAGYDLANALNPPSAALPAAVNDLPSQIDPRGLLTFGFTGIALLVVARLILSGKLLPASLGYVGYLSAILLLVLYVGRLIVLNPASPIILVPALLSGFIVSPLWYLMLSYGLARETSPKMGTLPIAQKA